MTKVHEKTAAPLKDKTAFILGLGGLGGYVAEILARSGIGNIVAADGDTFSIGNLNRQLLSDKTNLGKSKFLVFKARMEQICDAIVSGSESFIDETCIDTFARGADILIDCTDNIASRLMLEDYAKKKNLYLVHGAICGSQGQVAVISPGSRALKKLYHGADEHCEATFSATPALIASIQANEAIKLLLNTPSQLVDKLLLADLSDNSFKVLNLK